MGRVADFSDVTWREFFDSKRNRPAFHDRIERNKVHLVRYVSTNKFTFPGDEYTFAEDMSGARRLVATYFVYRDRVFEDGGTPSDFERPTADGWA